MYIQVRAQARQSHQSLLVGPCLALAAALTPGVLATLPLSQLARATWQPQGLVQQLQALKDLQYQARQPR